MKYLLCICLISISISASCQIAGPEVPKPLDQATYKKVEKMPIFPGCDEPQYQETDRRRCTSFQMKEFIKKNLIYPTMALQYEREGVCIVGFEIGQDGKITNVKLIKGMGLGTGAEAVKVVEKMNEEGIIFTPGQEDGELKIVSYILPIRFAHPNRFK